MKYCNQSNLKPLLSSVQAPEFCTPVIPQNDHRAIAIIVRQRGLIKKLWSISASVIRVIILDAIIEHNSFAGLLLVSDNQVAKHYTNCTTWLQAQNQSQILDPVDLNSVTIFLHVFMKTWHINAILVIVAIYGSSHFMKRHAQLHSTITCSRFVLINSQREKDL